MDKELSTTTTAILAAITIALAATALFLIAPTFFEGLALWLNATVGAALGAIAQSCADSVGWIGSLIGIG